MTHYKEFPFGEVEFTVGIKEVSDAFYYQSHNGLKVHDPGSHPEITDVEWNEEGYTEAENKIISDYANSSEFDKNVLNSL